MLVNTYAKPDTEKPPGFFGKKSRKKPKKWRSKAQYSLK